MVLRKLFSRAPRSEQQAAARQYRLPDGERIYAIGDVHGRLDCLDALMARIEADKSARGPADTTLVFLGDLMDRGADSRGVIVRAMEIAATRPTILLMGNHEEIFIHAWEGDRRAASLLHRVGGRETVMSYGVDAHDYDAGDLGELTELLGERVPASHITFLRNFADSYSRGDYLFVHAGIRPGVALEAQDPSDLRWIRREFLEDARDHGPMIIHGHSITEEVDERPNRIGIDTGAFASGKLTAIGIEGTERWFLTS
ncbi:metallophosphoesterase family protein [Sphingomonas sp.]|uniref:metallophosphoesterase family protein n=1 Tax=Sphingomonas sp. TaxID=28214 RepID=UPI0025D5008D|nr:metallophosphoesterase family protein [Sphingomonas sp.]